MLGITANIQYGTSKVYYTSLMAPCQANVILSTRTCTYSLTFLYHSGSLAIPDRPKASRFHNKLPLTIPDQSTECKVSPYISPLLHKYYYTKSKSTYTGIVYRATLGGIATRPTWVTPITGKANSSYWGLSYQQSAIATGNSTDSKATSRLGAKREEPNRRSLLLF